MGHCISRRESEAEFTLERLDRPQHRSLETSGEITQTSTETESFITHPERYARIPAIMSHYVPQMPGNNSLNVYDNKENKRIEIPLPYEFPLFGATCGVSKIIYIAGEYIYTPSNRANTNQQISPFLSVHIPSEEVKALAPLITRRSAFTLTAISANEMIAIAGCDQLKKYGAPRTLNECEIYNIEENSWSEFQGLNEARCNHGSCSYLEGKHTYVFGGYSDITSQPVASIERISIGKENNWDLIKLENHSTFESLGDSGCYLQCMPINQYKIIIFGEFYTVGFDTRTLDLKTMQKSPATGKLDCGYLGAIMQADFIFCFNGTKEDQILQYDLEIDNWDLIITK